MKKPEIIKLKYPLWFNITFYLLTIVFPLIILLVQGFMSPIKSFRISFGVVSIALIAWTFIRKFIIKNIETKIVAKKVALEHDYEIEVGSPDKIKWLWFTNELWLTLFDGIGILLTGGMFLLLAVGIQNAAIKVKAMSFIVAILYVLAYSMKTIVILVLRGKDEELENSEPLTK